MTRENLYDALTNVKDALVDEAAEPARLPGKKPVSRFKWAGIAAAVVLVLGAGGWWAVSHLHMGTGASGVSGHEDGSTVFMDYAGPVFPLTALDGGEDLTAERELTYDFSPWTKTWWSNEDEAASHPDLTEAQRQELLDNYNREYPGGGRWLSSTDLLVTDSYTLTNPTGEDRTVTLLYPFVGTLYRLPEQTPTLTVDGAAVETVLHAGGYSGGFEGAVGSEDSGLLLNLAQLNSWEQYKALLSDGRYLNAALGDYPDLSDTPVIVYKFTDAYGPERDHDRSVPNPTIQAAFDLDYDRTTVLSYGFNGAHWDWENGSMIQEFSIGQPGWSGYGDPNYLFIIGDDIQNLTTGGYVTGGSDPKTKRLGDGEWGVDVERYESDLESALREIAELSLRSGQGWEDSAGNPYEPDFALYFGLMKEFFVSCGPLSGNNLARYSTGQLDDSDFTVVDRVFYLESAVTVPAGGSVNVEARLVKEASFDYRCAHTEDQDIYGYDMVTKLGSNLDFTAQTAKAVNTGEVEIVRQNYGFDWENGITEVTLDPDMEHYYLEVRAIRNS